MTLNICAKLSDDWGLFPKGILCVVSWESFVIAKIAFASQMNRSHWVADPAAGFGGGKKHEIYVATFGGHLFYDLFLQAGEGGMTLLASAGSATVTQFDLSNMAVKVTTIQVRVQEINWPQESIQKIQNKIYSFLHLSLFTGLWLLNVRNIDHSNIHLSSFSNVCPFPVENVSLGKKREEELSMCDRWPKFIEFRLLNVELRNQLLSCTKRQR